MVAVAAFGCICCQIRGRCLLLHLFLLLQEYPPLALYAIVLGLLVVLLATLLLAELLQPHSQVLGGSHDLLELVVD